MSIDYRLVAILAADVVGYSRLMEAHEIETYTEFRLMRSTILDPGVKAEEGRIVKNTGDGFLAIFDSAGQAIRCALALQKAVTAKTAEQSADRRISFRMALNLADVIIDEGDIHGDGVNIAARLQGYAPAGGIVVSGSIAEQVSGDLGVGLIDLGELHLRNLSHPAHVFQLQTPMPPARLVGDAAANAELRPSIAVLPFRMHMTNPDEAYFADGIVDDIIQGLAALKELFVVSRGSTLGYGGSALDVRRIGRELGVRYLLYGSVRRSGGRLRINTELSDTDAGTLIDSNQYEGHLTDLFQLQDLIAVRVVKQIAPHIQERELTRALRKHPQDMTAYDLVLQALDRLYRMDYESFSRARGLLQQAISRDPTYGPAYSYSALWHIFHVGEIGSSDTDADAAAGAELAATAIELDSSDALALSIYGHVQSFLLRDYKKAMETLDRALEAGPNLAMAWTMSSATCGFVGDGTTAIERAEQGVRLTPLDARTFWHEGLLGQAHYVARNYEEALEWVSSAIERNESIRFNVRTLIATLVALGRLVEAAEQAQRFMRMQPEFRLGTYIKSCPFQGDILETWIARLRSSGLPD